MSSHANNHVTFCLILSGTCTEVESCTNGEKFADASDCEHFFECLNNALYHQRCPIGAVFYIDDLDCAPPSAGFDCEYRCPTTPPPFAPKRRERRSVPEPPPSKKWCKRVTFEICWPVFISCANLKMSQVLEPDDDNGGPLTSSIQFVCVPFLVFQHSPSS